MGCDIHMIAEAKIRDEWQTLGRVFEDKYYNSDRPSYIIGWEDDEEGWEMNAPYTMEPYSGRNYNLFAILADVRNGRGFAGVKTGEGFNPIAPPKGIPEDASWYSKKFLNAFDTDGHSHSYFTLKELLDYDWDQVTQNQGTVNMKEYKYFLENGKPDSWAGAIYGRDIRTVSSETMNSLIRDGIIDSNYISTVTWEESYRDCAGTFLTKTVPNLEAISEYEDVEDVRILFFFDN